MKFPPRVLPTRESILEQQPELPRPPSLEPAGPAAQEPPRPSSLEPPRHPSLEPAGPASQEPPCPASLEPPRPHSLEPAEMFTQESISAAVDLDEFYSSGSEDNTMDDSDYVPSSEDEDDTEEHFHPDVSLP